MGELLSLLCRCRPGICRSRLVHWPASGSALWQCRSADAATPSSRQGESRGCGSFIERWLLGRLRDRTFYSLGEVNGAIADLLHDLNDKRVLRRAGVTRRQLFEELDRPALRPLPVERYVFAERRSRASPLQR